MYNPIHGSFAKKVFMVILPFIREEGLKGVTTIAMARLEFHKETSSQQAAKALTKAVSQWVSESEDGRTCWKESCGDLNIGDLALNEKQFDAYLRGFKGSSKKALSLKGFEVVCSPFHLLTSDFIKIHTCLLFCGEADDGAVPFDRILAQGIPGNRW